VDGDQVNNYFHNEQITNITTTAQFVDELQKLRDEIEKIKSQPNMDPAVTRRMEVVQADIQDAIMESKKEKPVAERINTTLDGAKETMEKLGGSIGSAISLGTMLGSLAVMALKLFGGG
jgi:phosphoglycerate-specific signal transduction histidine kinase